MYAWNIYRQSKLAKRSASLESVLLVIGLLTSEMCWMKTNYGNSSLSAFKRYRVVHKNAQSSVHRYFATVCSKIMRFSPKCAKKDHGLYQSLQNLCQLLKCSLINNSPNWIHVMSAFTLHVNMMPLTVEDRLLIKTSQTEKGQIHEKWSLSFQRDSGNGITNNWVYLY